jgi:hypothetical protein
MFVGFPERRPKLFHNGDIFDMLPEQSPFMTSGGNGIFGETVQDMIDGWNPWVRRVKTKLVGNFYSHGKSGVITGITSITNFNAKNYVTPTAFAAFGFACMDDYPRDNIKDPIRAARAVTKSLRELHDHAGVPVVVREYGYSRSSDANLGLQWEILRAIWNENSKLGWVVGYSYWVGHGGAGCGQFCNLLKSQAGTRVPGPS